MIYLLLSNMMFSKFFLTVLRHFSSHIPSRVAHNQDFFDPCTRRILKNPISYMPLTCRSTFDATNNSCKVSLIRHHWHLNLVFKSLVEEAIFSRGNERLSWVREYWEKKFIALRTISIFIHIEEWGWVVDLIG